jgi:nuclear pore complex protein Nup133
MYRVVWPNRLEDLFGAGCTDSELSERFSSEDLRKPIIKDNVADDVILRDLAEKHRLAPWFDAAMKLAKKEVDLERAEEEARVQADTEIPAEYDELGGLEGDFLTAEIEAAASEAFEGDDEQSVADQDEEMEDA